LTPELEQLQAHLCALMTYRTAADLLGQMFPVDAGKPGAGPTAAKISLTITAFAATRAWIGQAIPRYRHGRPTRFQRLPRGFNFGIQIVACLHAHKRGFTLTSKVARNPIDAVQISG
jgi:hypothetical protein